MKKYLFLILLIPWLCGFSPSFVGSGGGEDNGCPEGTYVFAWNGEATEGSDYGCLNSGASTVQGADDAGTINSTSPIAGSYDALIDADDEGITFTTALSDSFDNAGTIEMRVKTPSTMDGDEDCQFAEFWYDGSNYIRLYNDDTFDIIGIRHEGGSSTEISDDGTTAQNTSYYFFFTWDVSTQKLCAAVSADDDPTGDWSCDTEDALTQFGTSGTEFTIGEYRSTSSAIVGSWYIDEVYCREGYEGP